MIGGYYFIFETFESAAGHSKSSNKMHCKIKPNTPRTASSP